MKKIYLLLILPLSPVFVITVRFIQALRKRVWTELIKSLVLALISVFVLLIIVPTILVETNMMQSELLEMLYLYGTSTIISILFLRSTDECLHKKI